MVLYADDCNCFFNFPTASINTNVINYELEKLSHWFSSNKLAFNVSKTKYMIISNRPATFQNDVQSINICGQALSEVTEASFLGILIDNKMTWKPHIQFVCNKVSKCIGILLKARKSLSVQIMNLLYNSLVLPYLQYCITVWGSAYPSLVTHLFILQKRAIKKCNRLPI